MIRTRAELEQAVKGLAALRERVAKMAVPGNRMYNAGWHMALDLHNMLVAAEAVARSALTREESRGAHTREDFPKTDAEKWGKVNVVCRRGPDGAMAVAVEPLPAWPDEARAIIEASLDRVATPGTGAAGPTPAPPQPSPLPGMTRSTHTGPKEER